MIIKNADNKEFRIEKDLTGLKFGETTIVSFNSKKGYMNLWNCLCDCGKTSVAFQSNLVTGKTKSCGCGVSKSSKTHGMSKDRIYQVWEQMIQRCTNKNFQLFDYYGGRGITVCDEWLHFENFYKDMGDSPTTKHQIDRIDNTKGYSKENCRWATASINRHNIRSHKNSHSIFKGVSLRSDKKKWVSQICKDGIKYYLGTYETQEQAAVAYDKKAVELYGNFASLNF